MAANEDSVAPANAPSPAHPESKKPTPCPHLPARPRAPSNQDRKGRKSKAREEVSAGGIVVRFTKPEPLVLIIRDSYRNWGFPKGHLEPGETAEQAALREVTEETGVRNLTVRAPLDCIDWHFRFRGKLVHKQCHFFLLETTSGFTKPQRSEGITACRWETLPRATELIAYENARAVLMQARKVLNDMQHEPHRHERERSS